MKKYRLRYNQKIIGYAEESAEGLLFKGKDWLYNLQEKTQYNQFDESLKIFDKLHREIYENDIVSFKLNPKEKEQQAVILWNKSEEEFMLYDIENLKNIPLFVNENYLFENDPLEIVSHLFNHKKLTKKVKNR